MLVASVGGGRITNICGLDSCNDDVADDPPLGGERNTALHWSLCIWPRTAQQVRTNETRTYTLTLSDDHVIFGAFWGVQNIEFWGQFQFTLLIFGWF